MIEISSGNLFCKQYCFQSLFTLIWRSNPLILTAFLYMNLLYMFFIYYCSVTKCPNLWDPMDCSMPDFFHCLPEFTYTHVHWVGDAIQPALPASVFPSIRVFSDNSAVCIRWPNYWSFSFSISPSSEYSGQISFRRCSPEDFLRIFITALILKWIQKGRMAICSSVLVWEIPWTEEPGGLQFLGLQELDMTRWLKNKKIQGKLGVIG